MDAGTAPAPRQRTFLKTVELTLLGSLSGRLLLLTAMIVMLAEVVIFVPSLAAFHRNWLMDKMHAAELALVTVAATPEAMPEKALHRALLQRTGVNFVTLYPADAAQAPVVLPMMEGAPPASLPTVDLLRHRPLPSIHAAFASLFAPPGSLIKAVGASSESPADRVEIILKQDALRADMIAFAQRIFALSLLISFVTAGLVYYALNRSIVEPIQILTQQILRFRDRPEDASRALRPSGRKDEIGRAEEALADMQSAVRTALAQQQRLAALGAAVARLSHDLRNSLATAQLVSDRLASSEDPRVRLVAPRLERAIARASRLAEAALRYGRAEEPPPQLERVGLAGALAEAAGDALAGFPQVPFYNLVGSDLHVMADREQLHRILVNLMRNAAQAMTREPDEDEPAARPPRLTATAHTEKESVRLTLADVGPGLPSGVLAKLFEPFSSAQRPDGTGLGLAIARELARAQGGDLLLASTSEEGVAFDLLLQQG